MKTFDLHPYADIKSLLPRMISKSFVNIQGKHRAGLTPGWNELGKIRRLGFLIKATERLASEAKTRRRARDLRKKANHFRKIMLAHQDQLISRDKLTLTLATV